MVLHDTDSRISLPDFGILIPVAPDRSARVLTELEKRLADLPRESWQLPAGDEILGRQELLLAHSERFVERLFSDEKERVILEAFELIDEHGNPFRYEPDKAVRPLGDLVDIMRRWSARTRQAGAYALSSAGGFCYHLGGGAHHAHREFGHGFCVINDLVLAARSLQADGLAKRIWIIDVDAHKGDGTAALTQGDKSIATLSIHMANAWPLDLPPLLPSGEPHPCFLPSDIDIPIAPGEEPEYLSRLEAGMNTLSSYPRPDIAYVVGGVDPYEHDELPSTQGLRLSLDQIVARDRMVFDTLRSAGIPQAWVMAGGYGERAWEPYVPFLEYAIRTTIAI